jgi:hypothetical protein
MFIVIQNKGVYFMVDKEKVSHMMVVEFPLQYAMAGVSVAVHIAFAYSILSSTCWLFFTNVDMENFNF